MIRICIYIYIYIKPIIYIYKAYLGSTVPYSLPPTPLRVSMKCRPLVKHPLGLQGFSQES